LFIECLHHDNESDANSMQSSSSVLLLPVVYSEGESSADGDNMTEHSLQSCESWENDLHSVPATDAAVKA
jgi:hypothetical protein